MKKKQHNPFRKALIVSLIEQGERSNIKIAAQARCSAGYVATIRYKLKKAAEPEPSPVVFELAEEESNTTSNLIVVFFVLAAIAAIISVVLVINSI